MSNAFCGLIPCPTSANRMIVFVCVLKNHLRNRTQLMRWDMGIQLLFFFHNFLTFFQMIRFIWFYLLQIRNAYGFFICSLLLSDQWTEVTNRGKREDKKCLIFVRIVFRKSETMAIEVLNIFSVIWELNEI